MTDFPVETVKNRVNFSKDGRVKADIRFKYLMSIVSREPDSLLNRILSTYNSVAVSVS
jgi:hypothetical protein